MARKSLLGTLIGKKGKPVSAKLFDPENKVRNLALLGVIGTGGLAGFYRARNKRKKDEQYISALIRKHEKMDLEKKAFSVVGLVKNIASNPTVRNTAAKGLQYAGKAVNRLGTYAGNAANRLGNWMGGLSQHPDIQFLSKAFNSMGNSVRSGSSRAGAWMRNRGAGLIIPR